jgi:hypothetical protein
MRCPRGGGAVNCELCGSAQPDGARFCGQCGAAFPDAWKPTPSAATVTRTSPRHDPVIRPRPADPATETLPPTDRPPDIVRYGPGVPATPPAGQAELTAERAWHGSGPAGPAGPSRRLARLRRFWSAALTVILLAASGVLLFLRFHHAPFRVTDVAIMQQTHNGCGIDVTGRITTNGSAGTVSYQWVFQPEPQPPRPLSQSVVGGQHAVYVTVVVEGQGHGTASRAVTLQVLGPDAKAVSERVVVSC